jgi:hypothetical protein
MPKTEEVIESNALPDSGEKIYTSSDSEPDDDFWLEQGRRMLTGTLSTIRTAANSLMTALGVLQGIYLGIIGFSKFIPETLPLLQKVLFIAPLIIWLLALYFCVEVAMTERLAVFLHSPSDIREESTSLILEKQRYLEWSFWLLALGLLTAFALLIYQLEMVAP